MLSCRNLFFWPFQFRKVPNYYSISRAFRAKRERHTSRKRSLLAESYLTDSSSGLYLDLHGWKYRSSGLATERSLILTLYRGQREVNALIIGKELTCDGSIECRERLSNSETRASLYSRKTFSKLQSRENSSKIMLQLNAITSMENSYSTEMREDRSQIKWWLNTTYQQRGSSEHVC